MPKGYVRFDERKSEIIQKVSKIASAYHFVQLCRFLVKISEPTNSTSLQAIEETYVCRNLMFFPNENELNGTTKNQFLSFYLALYLKHVFFDTLATECA